MTQAVTDAFVEHRSLLVGVAYRVLGTMSDAEDVVQDAWLRWSRADRADVLDSRAYLVTITTRLAMDRLRRRQATRETYVGEWLPEPILTAADPATDPAERSQLAESVSMGLMLVLESLSPLERAVFVLHDAFGFSFADIGRMLDKTEGAARQLGSRARRQVRERRPRFEVDEPAQQAVVERFFHASSTGDVDALLAVLSPGVTLVADSGGKTRAPLLPVTGAPNVARFLLAVAGRVEEGQAAAPAVLNGQPAVVVTNADGSVAAALVLEIKGDHVDRLYLVANPDKLRRL